MLKEPTFNLKAYRDYRLFILFPIIAVCLASTLYYILIWGTEKAHTHTFYIPIVLAGIWYHRKAVYVALFLSTGYVLALHFSPFPITLYTFAEIAVFVGVAYMVGFISQKLARGEEKKLRQEREFANTIIQSSPVFFVAIDADGKTIMMNDTMLCALGYVADEVVGKHCLTTFVPEGDRVMLSRVFEELTRLNKVTLNENRILTRDGRELLVEWHSRPVFKEKGEFDFFFSLGIDITERKRMDEALKSSFLQLAETTSHALEFRDPYTAGHQRNVAELARLVGERMGFNEERRRGLYIAGLLHDIGKISIPEEILTYPDNLREAEWALIRSHARCGYEILKDTNFPWPVAELACHHHERLDGSGYPGGLKGDELSLEVRILAVCDVVDAMLANRPYRLARPKEEIIKELRAGRGEKYDSRVVDLLLEIIESGKLSQFLRKDRKGFDNAYQTDKES